MFTRIPEAQSTLIFDSEINKPKVIVSLELYFLPNTEGYMEKQLQQNQSSPMQKNTQDPSK